jgi:hypothetical protein
MRQDRAPKIKSWSTCPFAPDTIAFMTYRGDVPRSPKTIPRVIIIPVSVSLSRDDALSVFISIFQLTKLNIPQSMGYKSN